MNQLRNNPLFARTWRRAVQAAVILLVFYMTLIGGFALGVREFKWRTITLTVVTVLWGVWYAGRRLGRISAAKSGLETPLLLMLVASVACTALSTDLRLSLDRLAVNLSLAIALLFTLDWVRDSWRVDLLVNALLVTGCIVSGIGLLEAWEWYGGDWFTPGGWRAGGVAWSLVGSLRVKSVLHNPNYLAYFLLLPIGLALWRLVSARTWPGRAAAAGILVLNMIALLLTKSRGGLLGSIATFGVAILLFGWSLTGRASRLALSKATRTVLAGAVAALLLLLLYPVVVRTDLGQAAPWGRRQDIWSAAWGVVKDHPILGAGPATFPIQYLSYRSANGQTAIFTHAHNVWLTVAAEYGAIGVLAVVFLFVRVAVQAFQYLRTTRPHEWSWMTVTGLFLLAGQGIHNLADDFMEFPFFSWCTLFAIALAVSPTGVRHPLPEKAQRRAADWLLGCGMLLLLIWAWWTGRAFARYDDARHTAQAGNWTQAADLLEEAVALDPGYNFYRQQLALAYGELARTDQAYLPRALSQQQKVVEQGKSYAPDLAYLACLSWQLGRDDAGESWMSQAVLETPPVSGGLSSWHLGKPTLQFNVGHYAQARGHVEAAIESYSQVLLTMPAAGTSPYWQADDERGRLLKAAADTARQMAAPTGQAAEIAYAVGDYELAYRLAAGDILLQCRALASLGRLQEAQRLLDGAAIPAGPALFYVQAEVLRGLGDLEAAEAAVQKAIALAPGEPAYRTLKGEISLERGDAGSAESSYRSAIALGTAVRTDYANLVAQRQPMPVELPFCLLVPYPADYLSRPALALADLLTLQRRDGEAAAILQRLLQLEPFDTAAQQRLDALGKTANPGAKPWAVAGVRSRG